VIAAIMIRWIFNDQFGIVNVVLEAIGLEGQPWLVQRWSAFGIILLTDIWLWTPWFTLLLLAGLQSLPKEPFEAAAIDGTTTWRVFRFLTLPMLRPVIVVCVVIRAIDAFRTFDIVWTLTGGGPGPLDRAVQPLCLCPRLPQPRSRPRFGGGDHRRAHHPRDRRGALPPRRPHRKGMIRWRW
jgi:ABC-type sugar transport system permease subunit